MRPGVLSACAMMVISGSAFADIDPPSTGPTERADAVQTTPDAQTPSTSADSRSRVVVRPSSNTPPESRDQRVTFGSMRISMPAWSRPTSDEQATPSSDPASAARTPLAASVRADGAIVMPGNTLGPGEAVWRVREREEAERRLLKARADEAEALADRAERLRYEPIRGSTYRRFGLGYVHGGGLIDDGWPRGPVTTTITRFNDPHSRAQRAFADAARPRGLFEAQEARDQAIRQFGKDAEPRIIQSQRDRDEAFLRANRDPFAPGPTTTETVNPK